MTPLGPDRVMIEFRGLGLKKAGVVLCPGGGFDVTPTDRIALMLKATLPRSDCPEAYELALGFETDHPTMSAGTAETLVEALGKKRDNWARRPDRRPSHRPCNGLWIRQGSSMKSSLRAQDGEIDTPGTRSHYDIFDRRLLVARR